MSKGLPYVPWFYGDFLRSTAGWLPMERFAYAMLLWHQWDQGSIPDDLERLASIVGLGVDELTSIWQRTIARKFKKTRSGLVNQRMAEHRAKVLAYHNAQSEKGRKGMAARWGAKQAEHAADIIKLRPEKAS